MQLTLSPSDLQPIIEQVATALLARIEADREKFGDRLAVGEAEAARLLSLAPHQLRDERRRGRITASLGPGNRILYSRQDLLQYLSTRRYQFE